MQYESGNLASMQPASALASTQIPSCTPTCVRYSSFKGHVPRYHPERNFLLTRVRQIMVIAKQHQQHEN